MWDPFLAVLLMETRSVALDHMCTWASAGTHSCGLFR